MSDNVIVSLRNIRRFFESGGETVDVLRDVNLDIERGSFNVIRGESGSGKTTLLRILGMLDTDFDGDMIFEDQGLKGKPDWYLDELRANNLGFIFQEGRLFSHLTLRKNVQIPLELHRDAPTSELQTTVKELEPQFFSSGEVAKGTLDLQPSDASGGQKQRASIMRAIVNEPSVILADEPTASLHGSLKAQVVDHLRALVARGHTVIVVSHDEVFYSFGRQLELSEGVLREVESGVTESSTPLPSRMPDDMPSSYAGWKPRARMGLLFRQALRETFLRPLFLSLVLVALIAGVCQVSVFSSIIVGSQAFVNEKITQGSRLNRVQIKPRAADKAEEDRFPQRADITAFEMVSDVVPRRITTTRVDTISGRPKTFSVSGLHADDPEYRLLNFVAGAPFSGNHDLPEVILTSALLGEVFDISALEKRTETYDSFLGREITIIVNRYNRGRKLVAQIPVQLSVSGIILAGEGGRQLYFPNTTLLVLDRFVGDRDGVYVLEENTGPSTWFPAEQIAEMSDFPWEDSLHVYSKEIDEVLPLFTRLSRMGYKPDSDIWDYKWALDIQDTAWRIFLPLLGLIIASVMITVAANIFTSAKLRETELALWRVLGMRRGDIVLTQVISTILSVTAGALAGLALGSALVWKTRDMLERRAAEAALATGSEPQEFDAIFAPVSSFFWPVMIAATALGLIAAVYPSIRTAKTDPAKVLKS